MRRPSLRNPLLNCCVRGGNSDGSASGPKRDLQLVSPERPSSRHPPLISVWTLVAEKWGRLRQPCVSRMWGSPWEAIANSS
jgi:hypothetical protein